MALSTLARQAVPCKLYATNLCELFRCTQCIDCLLDVASILIAILYAYVYNLPLFLLYNIEYASGRSKIVQRLVHIHAGRATGGTKPGH